MGRSAKPQLDLSQFLPYRLNNLAERISHALSGIYSQRFGISVAEWRVLAWVKDRELISAKQICDYTHMDKGRVSRAVQALEERDLIRRTPSETDLRVQFLRLTEAGETLLAELVPAALAWEADLAATLTAREHRELFSMLEKLERQLESMRRKPASAG